MDHHGLAGLDRESGVGLAACSKGGAAEQAGRPAHSSTQQKGSASRKKLERGAELGLERLGRSSAGALKKDTLFGAGESFIAERRDRRLLLGARAQLVPMAERPPVSTGLRTTQFSSDNTSARPNDPGSPVRWVPGCSSSDSAGFLAPPRADE